MTSTLTPVTRAVVEIYHAKLGASGASGWLNCPQWAGGGGSSIYAAAGSVTHEVAAECLTANKEPSNYIGQVFESDGFTVVFDDDMAATAKTYVDLCTGLATMGGYGGQLVEISLPIDHITGEPNAVSTIDFGLLPTGDGTEALLADLKTGRGEPVDAQDNPQMALYAIALLDEYGLAYDIQSVRMMIIQPPLYSVTEWVQTVEELEVWRARFAAAAAVSLTGTAPAVAGGKQCRWCSKKGDCPTLNNVVFEAVGDGDTDLASDELADALDKADMVETWIKGIRAEGERRLLDGRAVRGYKLVQGKKGHRKWSNEAEAEAMLKSMRIKHDAMYSYSLVSPTAAEKLAKVDVIGEKQWIKLQSLVTQSEGSPSVAPESDKRPALVIGANEFIAVEG